MKNRDTQLIEEAYTQVQEGILDRIKKAGSEAKAFVGGTGQQIKGSLKQGTGKALGGVLNKLGSETGAKIGKEISDTGTAQKAAASQKVVDAGKNTYIKSKVKDVINDLKVFGSMDSRDAEQKLSAELEQLLRKYL
tara:strand:- start:84 stop:491 length:408 start_codon:yes stop_codon:yes gene_type:complete